VFDAANLRQSTVRRAREGESLVALDGSAIRSIPPSAHLDDKGVEYAAGTWAGEATGCSDTTTDVLIESALWEP